MPIRLGLEVEFVPETITEVRKILSQYPFYYLIGSVHIVNNKVIVDSSIDNLPKNFCTDIFQQYWILIRKMASIRSMEKDFLNKNS